MWLPDTVLEQTHKTYFDQLNAATVDPHYEQLALPLDEQTGTAEP